MRVIAGPSDSGNPASLKCSMRPASPDPGRSPAAQYPTVKRMFLCLGASISSSIATAKSS